MKKGMIIIAVSVVAILVMLSVSSRFFVDLLWFSSMGLRDVFTTRWLTVFAVFVSASGLSFILLLLNGLTAARTFNSAIKRTTNAIL